MYKINMIEFKSDNLLRINVNKLALFVLLIGSTFQYGDFIVSRYFVPLISVLFSWLLFLLSSKRMGKFQINIFYAHVLFFIVFLFLSLIGNGDIEEFLFDFIKIFLAASTSFLVFYYMLFVLFFCECSHYPLQYLILIRILGSSMVSSLISVQKINPAVFKELFFFWSFDFIQCFLWAYLNRNIYVS